MIKPLLTQWGEPKASEEPQILVASDELWGRTHQDMIDLDTAFHKMVLQKGLDLGLDVRSAREYWQASVDASMYVNSVAQELSHHEALALYMQRRLETLNKIKPGYAFGLSRLVSAGVRWLARWLGGEFQDTVTAVEHFPQEIVGHLVYERARYSVANIMHDLQKKATGKEDPVFPYFKELHSMASNPSQLLQALTVLAGHSEWDYKRFKVSRGLAQVLWFTDLPPNADELFAPSQDGAKKLALPYPTFIVEFPLGGGPEFKGKTGLVESFRPSQAYVHVTQRGVPVAFAASKSDAIGGFALITALGRFWEPMSESLRETAEAEDWAPDKLSGTMAHLGHMVASCIMYVDSVSPQTTTVKAKSRGTTNTPRQREKEDRQPKSDYYVLGQDIVLAQGPSAGKEERDVGETMGVGFKHKYRYTVRGHWRNQACGKERKERKQVLVPPHWRGPDVASILHHEYAVKEKK